MATLQLLLLLLLLFFPTLWQVVSLHGAETFSGYSFIMHDLGGSLESGLRSSQRKEFGGVALRIHHFRRCHGNLKFRAGLAKNQLFLTYFSCLSSPSFLNYQIPANRECDHEFVPLISILPWSLYKFLIFLDVSRNQWNLGWKIISPCSTSLGYFINVNFYLSASTKRNVG